MPKKGENTIIKPEERTNALILAALLGLLSVWLFAGVNTDTFIFFGIELDKWAVLFFTITASLVYLIFGGVIWLLLSTRKKP